MKRPTRILALAGALIVLLLALLVVLPLLFRDRIAQRVKVEVNRTLDARVDWRDVGLTFFRDFPNLTLRLDDLTVVGIGRFEGDTLAAIRHLGVVLDLASVVGSVLGGGGKPIVVRSIELDQPRLSLIKLEDGTANWDITKKTPEAERQPQAAKPVAISLRRFEITRRRRGLRQSPGGAEGLAERLPPVPHRGFQPGPRRHPDPSRLGHGEPHLRGHPLPEPGEARPHRRRAGGPGEEVLHPQGHRAPAQRSAARRLGLGQHGRRRTSASTWRSTRPARSSGTSSRWCRRSTPTISSR